MAAIKKITLNNPSGSPSTYPIGVMANNILVEEGDTKTLPEVLDENFEAVENAIAKKGEPLKYTIDGEDGKYSTIQNATETKTVEIDGTSHNITKNVASGILSHAEGNGTTASGAGSHAEGINSVASGIGAHAEGGMSNSPVELGLYEIISMDPPILGPTSDTTFDSSKYYFYINIITPVGDEDPSDLHWIEKSGNNFIMSSDTTVDSSKTYAEPPSVPITDPGSMNQNASGIGAHAEGTGTTASGFYSHAEGNRTAASGLGAHAEGAGTTASGDYSHAEGIGTTASDYYSHAEGSGTTASGLGSHTEGNDTTASGSYSHAEGGTVVHDDVEYKIVASEFASHAEGGGTTASEKYSHSEGYITTASGEASHAEGYKTEASGDNSHAEGFKTEASGDYSHTEGYGTQASGRVSHAQGSITIAQGNCQTVIGRANIAQGTANSYVSTDQAFIIGNGSDSTNRSNAFFIQWDGAMSQDNGLTKFKFTKDDSGNKGYIDETGTFNAFGSGGGGGGGGGHTIVDTAGTALTTRTKLQFKDMLVTDDGEKTVVSPDLALRIPIDPSTTPTANGSIWISTT